MGPRPVAHTMARLLLGGGSACDSAGGSGCGSAVAGLWLCKNTMKSGLVPNDLFSLCVRNMFKLPS